MTQGFFARNRLIVWVFYFVCAAMHLIYTALFYRDSQTDLLRENFRLQAQSLEHTLILEPMSANLTRARDPVFEDFKASVLVEHGIRDFLIFDATGQIWHTVIDDPDSRLAKYTDEVPGSIRAMSAELEPGVPPRTMELRLVEEGGLAANIVALLSGPGDDRLYFFTNVRFDRLQQQADELNFVSTFTTFQGL